ncbi:hypothetical protein [Aquisphaera insulae]|uniref:hypothetical protein n=1 Tax=Aquisphaera insulae TaxID=2712864 RepID=UPI0013EA79EC|nr:hypothetical protein [Aquisphaera insulae]
MMTSPRRPLILALALSLVLGGCGGPPQVAADNREIITSLATAVSARNSEWLESNARLIEKRRAEGHVSDAEHQVFSAIVAKARSGDWPAAERDAYALREAQAPTAEDLKNLERRKLDPGHRGQKAVAKIPLRGRSPQ